MPTADAQLVQQLRSGDTQAGYHFVQEYYPGIYRHLLYLTGRPELAADLTQETFLQAWRRLETYDGRGPLRPWLHQIARREFLQALRSQRPHTSLEEVSGLSTPPGVDWTESVALHDAIRKLSVEEGEVVMLHYLQGYTCEEIAQIVRAPAGTVKYRLSSARTRLQQELGEGDLIYLNEPGLAMRGWSWLPLDQMQALEARLHGSATGAGAAGSSEPRHRTGGPNAGAGRADPEREANVVDSRLTRKVTLAFKATALSDLCNHLRAETGIHLTAGTSVADEKVTLFCEKLPLREVMRQLSRPFGYAWVRSGRQGEFKYELMQDLRSQLLEEELRNRDRNKALLVLEREIERYRPYLDLSPDEALARAKNAPPEEKKLLERFADLGWGPIQMYFRLSSNDLSAIRAGQWLVFSQEPRPGEQPLPPEVARGVIQSLREERIIRREDGFGITTDQTDPRGVPLTAVPEMRAQVKLSLSQLELGQFALEGSSGRFARNGERRELNGFSSKGPLAIGKSQAVTGPDNATANARLAREPALRPRVKVKPQPSCNLLPPSRHANPGKSQDAGEAPPPKVTTADVLEALHRATGMPIISDHYTRLHRPEAMSVRDETLFEALNRLSDAMRLRWNKEGNWLQFRSASFYDDRLKEVPNRLLARWVASRQQHGMLTLDDIVEIAQLSDAQLDGTDMAEGARECFGLAEWDLARYGAQRPHLRYLASFTPSQRQEMMSAAGLAFTRMSLPQQQQFIAFALLPDQSLQSLEELAGAVLRVDYTVPGWFQWGNPDQLNLTRWVIPLEPIPRGQRVLRLPVRERTREAALAAVRRIDPRILEALAQEWQRQDPRAAATSPADEAQIFPTRLDLTIIYVPGSSNARSIYVWFQSSDVTFY